MSEDTRRLQFSIAPQARADGKSHEAAYESARIDTGLTGISPAKQSDQEDFSLVTTYQDKFHPAFKCTEEWTNIGYSRSGTGANEAQLVRLPGGFYPASKCTTVSDREYGLKNPYSYIAAESPKYEIDLLASDTRKGEAKKAFYEMVVQENVGVIVSAAPVLRASDSGTLLMPANFDFILPALPDSPEYTCDAKQELATSKAPVRLADGTVVSCIGVERGDFKEEGAPDGRIEYTVMRLQITKPGSAPYEVLHIMPHDYRGVGNQVAPIGFSGITSLNWVQEVHKILANHDGHIVSPNKPMLVHCNTGCDRTGQFIVLDTVLRLIDKAIDEAIENGWTSVSLSKEKEVREVIKEWALILAGQNTIGMAIDSVTETLLKNWAGETANPNMDEDQDYLQAGIRTFIVQRFIQRKYDEQPVVSSDIKDYTEAEILNVGPDAQSMQEPESVFQFSIAPHTPAGYQSNKAWYEAQLSDETPNGLLASKATTLAGDRVLETYGNKFHPAFRPAGDGASLGYERSATAANEGQLVSINGGFYPASRFETVTEAYDGVTNTYGYIAAESPKNGVNGQMDQITWEMRYERQGAARQAFYEMVANELPGIIVGVTRIIKRGSIHQQDYDFLNPNEEVTLQDGSKVKCVELPQTRELRGPGLLPAISLSLYKLEVTKPGLDEPHVLFHVMPDRAPIGENALVSLAMVKLAHQILADHKHTVNSEHPMMVHCTTGRDRTGQFILLDTVLRLVDAAIDKAIINGSDSIDFEDADIVTAMREWAYYLAAHNTKGMAIDSACETLFPSWDISADARCDRELLFLEPFVLVGDSVDEFQPKIQGDAQHALWQQYYAEYQRLVAINEAVKDGRGAPGARALEDKELRGNARSSIKAALKADRKAIDGQPPGAQAATAHEEFATGFKAFVAERFAVRKAAAAEAAYYEELLRDDTDPSSPSSSTAEQYDIVSGVDGGDRIDTLTVQQQSDNQKDETTLHEHAASSKPNAEEDSEAVELVRSKPIAFHYEQHKTPKTGNIVLASLLGLLAAGAVGTFLGFGLPFIAKNVAFTATQSLALGLGSALLVGAIYLAVVAVINHRKHMLTDTKSVPVVDKDVTPEQIDALKRAYPSAEAAKGWHPLADQLTDAKAGARVPEAFLSQTGKDQATAEVFVNSKPQ